MDIPLATKSSVSDQSVYEKIDEEKLSYLRERHGACHAIL